MYTCPRELGKVFLQLFKPPTTVLIITAVRITLVIGAQIHFLLHSAFYVVALDSWVRGVCHVNSNGCLRGL